MRLVDKVSKTKRFERQPETAAFLLDPVVDVFDTPPRALSAFFFNFKDKFFIMKNSAIGEHTRQV